MSPQPQVKPRALDDHNRHLASLDALARIEWAFENLPGAQLLSSSFGAQAAVCLHLVTRVDPNVPIVLIDTGYLFPETYCFIDTLVERLGLNLKVYRSELSPAWQEARHGQLWAKGADGLAAYNLRNKVEPMRRALDDLGAGTWIAGLRRAQSRSRATIDFLERAGSRYKLHPIADWSNRDVDAYLRANDLPYHPLWDEGYVSIGDTHTTRPLHEVESAEATRFFGIKRECGLHEMSD